MGGREAMDDRGLPSVVRIEYHEMHAGHASNGEHPLFSILLLLLDS